VKIAMVASEAVPYAKTGGLADVAGTLPREFADLGHDVRLIIPKYRIVDKNGVPLESENTTITIPLADRLVEGNILTYTGNEIITLFIENNEFYDRDGLYGNKEGDFPDNASRFTFFSKAVLSTLKEVDFRPDIIHLHDWQTALISLYLKATVADDPFFSHTASIFTIHNLGYQGHFWHLDMPLLGVGWEYFTPEGIEFYGKINFLKAGIVYSDAITTVSETYAHEIQTEEHGFGLDGILRTRRDDIFGIINGIDTELWNPATDPHITANYDAGELSGKAENKKTLLREFHLPEKALSDEGKNSTSNHLVPLIGIISRLADQKGFDILASAFDDIMSMDVMIVILGTGEHRYHELLTKLGKKYPTKLGVKLAFDPRLAHLIEAGSDMFLMPSRYEPCGLNQMMSMRYGTIPVVRATGGLDDTVEHYSKATGAGTGIKFIPYTPEALIEAITEAVSLYHDKKHWEKMISNAMAQDFSWRASAKKYEKLYAQTIEKKMS
jgi:starch synthase